MSLVLHNLQKVVPLRRAQLRKNIAVLQNVMGVQHFDLAVICVDNQKIQKINKMYRQKDAPADVLSFPFYEELKAGELPQLLSSDERTLGDIFLGVEYIYEDCQKYKEDFYNVLTVTTAHGLCHLLGYRHSTKTEWEQMFLRESQILEEFNKITGGNLQPLTKNLF
ncbi:endoribonuclease YbeY [Protopterus annectens]|uniref:endoribonuclease YbeY n=1 Tax=Protopterus annectens TaxID=7888 RepID=UPI001CFB1970|nr:endoribonuclease YbeY [Protopterus annectens]XP_043916492.1 endoribonuclease YbeY [Protopterus annectens]